MGYKMDSVESNICVCVFFIPFTFIPTLKQMCLMLVCVCCTMPRCNGYSKKDCFSLKKKSFVYSISYLLFCNPFIPPFSCNFLLFYFFFINLDSVDDAQVKSDYLIWFGLKSCTQHCAHTYGIKKCQAKRRTIITITYRI